MPLRSVEAATRDDAIAAAREQFGPTARVVGVRRVRSGGVLGFFATERYVAEVASDPAGRPVVPVPAASRSAEAMHDDEPPSDFSSPLASATPARARAGAPARNGAAAWAAEAARTSRDLPASAPASSPALPQVATAAAPDVRLAAAPRNAPARTGSQPAMPRADQDRVSELAGLLTAQDAPEPPVYSRARYPRAEFQRTGSTRSQDDAGRLDDELHGGGAAFGLPAASPSSAPSPFTAALARMVAGDRDVRQAVREALDDPAAPRPRSDGGSRPTRPGALGPADTPVASPASRQKEETVGDQVIAPSTFADQPAEVPARTAAPEAHAPSTSSREEAIAEVLRAALAQGHSDEALAGILRRVLAGVAPQTALAEPELVIPMRAAPDVVAPVHAPAPVVEPVAVEPAPAPAAVDSSPAVALPPVVDVVTALPPVAPVTVTPAASLFPATTAPAPVAAAPAPLFAAPTPYFAAPAPFALPPLFAPSADSMWGDPSPAPLWGEPVTRVYTRTRQSDEPIWAEISQQEATAAAVTVETESAPVDEYVAGSEELVGAEFTVTEFTVTEDAPADLPDANVVRPEVAAAEVAAADAAAEAEAAAAKAEAAAAEIAAAEIAAAAAAAAEAEAAEIAAAEIAAAEAVSELAEATLEAETDVEVISQTETILAEQVEDALAEMSADERVQEFLAEADAEKVVETETSVDVETAVESAVETETAVETEIAELAPMMARTASDPAPMMSLDATTVMPPLSLLPPLPSSRGRGRPPVPPASRPLAPRTSAPAATPPAPSAEPTSLDADNEAPAAPVSRSWATVTRLPVAPLMATPEIPDMPELDTDEPAEPADAPVVEPETADQPAAGEQAVLQPSAPAVAPQPSVRIASGDLQSQLEALGLPRHLLGDTFAEDVAGQGTYAALTRALALRLPAPPQLPSGAGEVLFVVGPGVETLRAARALAASLRLDRDSVQWATRGELAGLAPKASRMTTVETAMDRRQDAAASGTVTIVAVDAPLRSDAYWMSQMLAIWAPTAVWVVVEATRKPEDLEPWIDGLPRVDALVVTDTDLSADPAAVLRRVAAPVAIVDGVRATPHRWASLLCERLESTQA